MKTIQEAYIVAATRSPIGKAPKGTLRFTRPDDLLAQVISGLMQQLPSLDPAAIADAVVGCAIPEGPQGLNIARMSVLLAGLPNSIGGITVNRFCSSSLSAIAMAADRIRLGEADLMIAAGVESMSLVPMMGNTPSLSPEIFNQEENLGIAYGMGLTAEKVATQWKVSREDQDAFALASHQKALAAKLAGEFNAETLGIKVASRSMNLNEGRVDLSWSVFKDDEGPRSDTSIEGLSKLKTVFASRGSVTAGNSSQMSDGAGALMLASEKAVKTFGLTPMAKFVSFSVKGVPPEIMGIGPKEAIPAALKLAGIRQADLDWIELNEAFAAQSLAVMRDLNLDPAKVNPLGGAIALGHPLGATGAIRTATLLHAMQRHHLKYGMVTMCVGTGMGAAGIFERV